MIQHRWSIACTQAVVDRYTNNVSLEHIIEQISVREPLPSGNVIPIEFDIMTLWATDDPGDTEIAQSRLTIVAPDGQELGSTQVPVDLSQHKRLRSRLHLSGLPFAGHGQYVFRVDLQLAGTWEAAGHIYMDVVQADPAEQEGCRQEQS